MSGDMLAFVLHLCARRDVYATSGTERMRLVDQVLERTTPVSLCPCEKSVLAAECWGGFVTQHCCSNS